MPGTPHAVVMSMQHLVRPTVFARALSNAVTVRPLLTALREMKRARIRDAQVAAPAPAPLPELAPQRAA